MIKSVREELDFDWLGILLEQSPRYMGKAESITEDKTAGIAEGFQKGFFEGLPRIIVWCKWVASYAMQPRLIPLRNGIPKAYAQI